MKCSQMIGLAHEAVEMLHLDSVRCGHPEPFRANVTVKVASKEMNFEVCEHVIVK